MQIPTSTMENLVEQVVNLEIEVEDEIVFEDDNELVTRRPGSSTYWFSLKGREGEVAIDEEHMFVEGETMTVDAVRGMGKYLLRNAPEPKVKEPRPDFPYTYFEYESDTDSDEEEEETEEDGEDEDINNQERQPQWPIQGW